jgi:PAS domain S-box-containing protein
LVGVILVAINREGTITLLNKKGYEVLEYEEGGLVGKNWFDTCIPQQHREELKNVFKALIEGDLEPFEYYSNPIITSKGDERMISWHNDLLRDDDGSIVASLSSGEDITDLKETEEKLKESQEHMRNLFNSIPMGIHMYHLYEDGRLVFIGANPAADEILHLDNMEFIGKTIEEAFPPLIESDIPKRYRELAKNGGYWKWDQYDYEDEKIQGAFEVHAFQISPMYMVATFLDIAERIETEDKLKKRIMSLEKELAEVKK